jgi:U3 small nucleolar RNA-associated protein 14
MTPEQREVRKETLRKHYATKGVVEMTLMKVAVKRNFEENSMKAQLCADELNILEAELARRR